MALEVKKDSFYVRDTGLLYLDTLTQEQKTLLPKDKHDIKSISHLSTLPSATVTPLIPELLKWIQDPNWPIFSAVVQLLNNHRESCVASVKEIMRSDDAEWIVNCLKHVVLDMNEEQKVKLKGEIERIAEKPTVEEQAWEGDQLAKEISRGMGWEVYKQAD